MKKSNKNAALSAPAPASRHMVRQLSTTELEIARGGSEVSQPIMLARSGISEPIMLPRSEVSEPIM
jgi:hypothetical protein